MTKLRIKGKIILILTYGGISLEKNNINLTLDEKEHIVESIINGLEKSNNYFDSNRTITKNGREGERWNYINQEVKVELSGYEKFDVSLCKRKIWEIILIYDKETRNLYSLMKDQRFRELRDDIEENGLHYAAVIASKVNSHLEYEVQEQINFLDNMNNLLDEKVEESFKDITKYIPGDIDKYTMITFSNKNEELISISGRIVSSTLQNIYKEDWSDLIKPKYNMVIEEILGNIQLDDDNEEEVEVGIKVNVMQKNNKVDILQNDKKENIKIELKKHQEEKQEN